MNRRVIYIQCAKREADHPMRGHVDDISDNGKVTSHAFYSVGYDGDDLKHIKVRYRQISTNRINVSRFVDETDSKAVYP